jgi:hypothetical protein
MYVCMAFKYDNTQGHSYLVGVCNSLEKAEEIARAEVESRGGKYGVQIYYCVEDESERVTPVEYIPSHEGISLHTDWTQQQMMMLGYELSDIVASEHAFVQVGATIVRKEVFIPKWLLAAVKRREVKEKDGTKVRSDSLKIGCGLCPDLDLP